MSHVLNQEVREGAFRLGAELASPNQFIDSAVSQLNINLAAIGCEPSVKADYVRGSWQTAALTPKSPPFSRAVRAATSSILWRPDSLADTLPIPGSVPVPDASAEGGAVWSPAENVNFDELIKGATEGVTWEDPQEAGYRNRIADTNARILREVIGGLASKGYSERRSGSDMRQEFNEILDSLVLRTSYHCIVEARVISRTMRKAGIANVLSPYNTLRRYGKAALSR